MTKLATLFLACGNGGLVIFFDQEIDCMELFLWILDAAAVAATFMCAAAANVAPTVSSTGLNAGNFLGQLILWNFGYSGCEVIIRL